jgi:hypothetical protein
VSAEVHRRLLANAHRTHTKEREEKETSTASALSENWGRERVQEAGIPEGPRASLQDMCPAVRPPAGVARGRWKKKGSGRCLSPGALLPKLACQFAKLENPVTPPFPRLGEGSLTQGHLGGGTYLSEDR